MSVSEHASLVNSQVHQDLEAPTTVYQPEYLQQQTGNNYFANNCQNDDYNNYSSSKKQSKKVVLTVLGTVLAIGALTGTGFGIYSCTHKKILLEEMVEHAQNEDGESMSDYMNRQFAAAEAMAMEKLGGEEQGAGSALNAAVGPEEAPSSSWFASTPVTHNTIDPVAKTNMDGNSTVGTQTPFIINITDVNGNIPNNSCCLGKGDGKGCCCGYSCCTGCGYCMLGYCASNLLCMVMDVSYLSCVTKCEVCKSEHCGTLWKIIGLTWLDNFLTCNCASIGACDKFCGGHCVDDCVSNCGATGSAMRDINVNINM